MEKANVIQKAFYRSAAYLKRHSPTILTFVGATGVVAVSYTHLHHLATGIRSVGMTKPYRLLAVHTHGIL